MTSSKTIKRPTLSISAGGGRKVPSKPAQSPAEPASDEQTGAVDEPVPTCLVPISIEHVQPAAAAEQLVSAGSADTVADATLAPPAGLPSPAPQMLAKAPAPAAPAQAPVRPPMWSSGDEAALQALLARRKAAGYQRRGKDVSGQLIRPGNIAPNPETVVATIVALVAARGTVSRAELLDLMAAATFPHPKARPSDRGWCQGYVAGAIRSGFLALADQAAAHEPTADAWQEAAA